MPGSQSLSSLRILRLSTSPSRAFHYYRLSCRWKCTWRAQGRSVMRLFCKDFAFVHLTSLKSLCYTIVYSHLKSHRAHLSRNFARLGRRLNSRISLYFGFRICSQGNLTRHSAEGLGKAAADSQREGLNVCFRDEIQGSMSFFNI